MTPEYADEWLTVLGGDCRDVLRTLPASSVHCVITSPPYWGLRDYGTASWAGGDEDCDHRPDAETLERQFGAASTLLGTTTHQKQAALARDRCKCGATRQDSQLGLEATPEEYVATMVDVFREVRRVLRDDGTLWLNLGDSYANDTKWGGSTGGKHVSALHGEPIGRAKRDTGLKSKDLVGIPWRVAFALQQPYYTGTIRDEKDRIWLAAMIEAEGCLFLHRRRVGQSNGQGYVRKHDTYGAGLEVANTSLAIIERCMAIVGRGSISSQSPEQNARRKQTIYRWSMRSNECREVIREVYPYLVGKQHQARLLLGCPSSGEEAERAHRSLIALHNGGDANIDFPAPASMYERGWYLRSDIVWSLPKPNPMPESVTDRPTKSHEYLFLLSKSPRYYFDADAVREASIGQNDHDLSGNGYAPPGQSPSNGNRIATKKPDGWASHAGGHGSFHKDGREAGAPGFMRAGRNIRSVWTIATAPYPGAHFATFPPKLVEPCVKAGTSERGVCPECGAPWERVVERTKGDEEALVRPKHLQSPRSTLSLSGNGSREWAERGSRADTTGWRPTCKHDAEPVPAVVMDPFAGTGTVGMVAQSLSRKAVLIELNPDYVRQIKARAARGWDVGGPILEDDGTTVDPEDSIWRMLAEVP